MVVGAPEVRTVASTEVGFITFGLVDPLPVEVTSEVDVERAQAAALVRAAGIQHSTHVNIYWSPPMGGQRQGHSLAQPAKHCMHVGPPSKHRLNPAPFFQAKK